MSTERFTCINNEGYDFSLEMSATYDTIPDEEAAKHQMIRVIDETGEDYLFLKSRFVPAGTNSETHVRFFGQTVETLASADHVGPLTGRKLSAQA